MAEHTPTPWEVDEDYPNTIVQAGSNASILDCEFMVWSGETLSTGSDNLNEANAAFIVKACNAHEALVECVQELLRVYWGDGDGHYPEPQCILNARKALALTSAQHHSGDQQS